MKQAIIGYITGIINNHNRIVESMEKYNYGKQSIQIHKNCINEITDLLNFIKDIPEEKQELIAFNFNTNDGEVEELKHTISVLKENKIQMGKGYDQLRSRIKELEESCECMCEVERNLTKKLNQANDNNCMWQKTCNELADKIEYLEGKDEHKNIKTNC